jgi:hypothetical protein
LVWNKGWLRWFDRGLACLTGEYTDYRSSPDPDYTTA